MKVRPLPQRMFDASAGLVGSTADWSVERRDALRRRFLSSLRSEGEGWARYRGSPLRYAGGKSLAVGAIVEVLPSSCARLVSPFFGGGSVEVACANDLGLEVLGFDVLEPLVAYWRCQLDDADVLADRLGRWRADAATFAEVRERMRRHWEGLDVMDDGVELAAHFFFSHNTSYGPSFLGWPSSVYLDEARYEAMLSRVRGFRAPSLSVGSGDFADVIGRFGGEVLYCDPPYYLDDGEMFAGIYPNRNWPIHHVGFDHEGLRDLLLAHEGGWVLSYNDCETIREWYDGYEVLEPSWQYTMGQGETRIGRNRAAAGGSHVKRSHELLIVNV